MVAAHTGGAICLPRTGEKLACYLAGGSVCLENALKEQLLAATLDGDIERLEELLVQVAAKEPELAAYARELAGRVSAGRLGSVVGAGRGAERWNAKLIL